MKIHALRCAAVTIKLAHYQAYFPTLFLRGLHLLFGQRFTDPLPVWAWVIEHPEGVIVVDTGENIRVFEPNYYSPANAWVHQRVLRLQLQFQAEDQIAPQLNRLGIRPQDVRWVVQTHLHTDHSGGLHAFPQAQILIAGNEWRRPIGNVPEQYPTWLKPTLIEYTDGVYHTFPQSHRLTQAGDVRLVPTPGHTFGHQSVVIEEGSQLICLVGDACFDEAQLLAGRVGGISFNARQARTALTQLQQLGRQNAVVYLPSHDPLSAERLANRRRTLITP